MFIPLANQVKVLGYNFGHRPVLADYDEIFKERRVESDAKT